MTHEEVRRLVPRYAAGDLPSAAADAVRAHLASGCAGCLADVFRRPVGLPIPSRGAGPPRVAPPGVTTRTRRWRAIAVAGLVLLVAMLAVIAVFTCARVRGLERAAHVDAGRARAAEAARMALGARVEQLERERARAETEAARQAAAARVAGEMSATLQRRLESAEARPGPVEAGVAPPGGQVARLLGSLDARRALEQLAAMPGVELLRLTAVAAYGEARGHVLWHPARAELVVYAFGLPPPRDGVLYRVRLVGAGGGSEEAVAFRPAPTGDIVLPVRVRGGLGALWAVEVVRDGEAGPVLRGEVTGGGPAR